MEWITSFEPIPAQDANDAMTALFEMACFGSELERDLALVCLDAIAAIHDFDDTLCAMAKDPYSKFPDFEIETTLKLPDPAKCSSPTHFHAPTEQAESSHPPHQPSPEPQAPKEP
jgi:hypothetical protein